VCVIVSHMQTFSQACCYIILLELASGSYVLILLNVSQIFGGNDAKSSKLLRLNPLSKNFMISDLSEKIILY